MQNPFAREPRTPVPIPPPPPVSVANWVDATPIDPVESPCTVTSLDVQARVCGIYAEVTQVMGLFNPNSHPTSASLTIPLPDRAVVCGYALEIGNAMVDGVVVPKERARVIFEAEESQGGGPALVESVKGNVYRTRVSSVEPRGTRRIRLRYVAPLMLATNGSATIDLPMPDSNLSTRRISIDVETLRAPAPFVWGIAHSRFLDTSLWNMTAEEYDVTPTEHVRLTLPQLPDAFALLERDRDGTVWFCATEALPAPTLLAVPPLRTLTVLWDASGSRAGQSHMDEIAQLCAYASSRALTRITLVVFANEVQSVRAVRSVDELVRLVSNVQYDGGTDLHVLGRTIKRFASEGPCVLFTDGIDTLSDRTLALPDECRVLAVVSGAERDLEAMRQAFHGLAFDLSLAPRDADELARTFADPSLGRRLVVRGRGLADVCDVSAPNGGRIAILGRLTDDRAVVSLGRGTRTFELRAEDARDGDVLACAWGARRVSILSPHASQFADELLDLGRRFGMASPATSLLVLETLDQWLRYDVEPPASLAQIHDLWVGIKEENVLYKQRRTSELEHRASLASGWRGLLSWWDEKPAGHGTALCPMCGSVVEPDVMYCIACGSRVRGKDDPSLDAWRDSLPPWEYLPTHRQAPAELSSAWASVGMELPQGSYGSEPSQPMELPSAGAPPTTDAKPGFKLSLPSISLPSLRGKSPLRKRSPKAEGPAKAADKPLLRNTAPDDAATRSRDASVGEYGHMSGMALSSGSWSATFVDRPRMAEPLLEEASPPFEAAADVAFGASYAAPSFDAPPREATAMPAQERVEEPSTPTIMVLPWESGATYLEALERALPNGTAATHEAYLALRPVYASSPSFFADCGAWFLSHGDRRFGLRVLGNLAEMRIEDATLLRVLAWRLREAGELVQALVMLRRVLRLREEDPQSHRDVAIVLDELARKTHAAGYELAARRYAEEAGELYRNVALKPWEAQSQDLGLFAVEEYNVLRDWAQRVTWGHAPKLPSLGRDLEGVLVCDLRVTLSWDTDEADVKLHVTEPTGEEANAWHPRTLSGGRVCAAAQDGRGQKLYEIREAPVGTFAMQANHQTAHRKSMFGPATCTLTVYRNWGTPDQQQSITSTRLDGVRGMLPIGSVQVAGNATNEREKPEDKQMPQPHRIAVGMGTREVLKLMGPPVDERRSGADLFWTWDVGRGRRYIVLFENDKVRRVSESMPWGELMVIAQ